MRRFADPDAYRFEWGTKEALLTECASWLRSALSYPIKIDCESRDLARAADLTCKNAIRRQQKLGNSRFDRLRCEVHGRFLLIRGAPPELTAMTPQEMAARLAEHAKHVHIRQRKIPFGEPPPSMEDHSSLGDMDDNDAG
jgi:hypothetical protein